MAQFVFYVGRKGHAGVQCTASLPKPRELSWDKPTAVTVDTPEGKVEATVPPLGALVEAQLTIVLQNAVRDTVFPPTGDTKTSTKRATGFVE